MEGENSKGDNIKVVEDVIEVDEKKMKRVRTYEMRKVKRYTPKGVLERQKITPFNVDEMGEASTLDRNPVFFEVHGKSKQIKVKVNTLTSINEQLKEIENEIKSKKVEIQELDTGPEIDSRDRNRFDKPINEDAVVRVSNIPNEMNIHQVRDMFSRHGKIIMMSMPKPFIITEEEKRFQRKREKFAKKMAKRMAKNNPDASQSAEQQEEKKAVEEAIHRGYAYIYFEHAEQANEAIKWLNERAFHNQIISVRKAKPRPRT